MTTKWLHVLAALAMIGAGCGDDDGGPTDAGGDTDAGPGVDAGPREPGFGPNLEPPAGPLPAAQTAPCPDATREDCISLDDDTMIAMGAPADLSCVGMRTEPMRGAEQAFTLQIRDCQEDDPTPDVCVEVYGDNLVPTGTTSCGGMTTDAMGQIMAMAGAGGWYAYRVFPKPGMTPATTVVGSIQYNEQAPSMAGDTSQGISISGSTINLIPTLLGFTRTPGTAILAGTFTDCNDDPVYGARIQVRTPDGTLITEGSAGREPHYRYFNGTSFPSGRQPWTHIDGLFALANAAPSNMPVTVEVYARRMPGGPVELVGCEQGVLLADTGTILNISPLRSDGPDCGD